MTSQHLDGNNGKPSINDVVQTHCPLKHCGRCAKCEAGTSLALACQFHSIQARPETRGDIDFYRFQRGKCPDPLRKRLYDSKNPGP